MLVRMKGLEKRGGVWKYRRMVPERLRSIIGSYQVIRSFGTADLEVVQRRWPAVKAEVDRLFEEAEAAFKNPSVRVYKAVQRDVEDRRLRPRTTDEEDAESLALTSVLETLETVHTPAAVVHRATVEAVLKSRGDDQDDADNPPLSILFDRWRDEKQPPAKTWEEWCTARKRFEVVIGGDMPVRSVTKEHVRAFRQALVKMPARRRGVDQEGRPVTLSPASIQKQLNAVKSVLSWAVREGYLERNPADGITHARSNGNHGATVRRLPWDNADLKTLLSTDREDGADRWLPLLALWTGARLEELGQLHVDDVGQEDGIPYIHIRAGDGRHVKNRGSERQVPIHPELVKRGFLTYVERIREQGHTRVFPELKPDRHGKLTRMWSKRFRYFARSLGLTDPRKTFHSFRHTFKDACRRAGISEEVHDALTGHTSGGIGRQYGLGVPLQIRAEAIARIRYDTFPHVEALGRA